MCVGLLQTFALCSPSCVEGPDFTSGSIWCEWVWKLDVLSLFHIQTASLDQRARQSNLPDTSPDLLNQSRSLQIYLCLPAGRPRRGGSRDPAARRQPRSETRNLASPGFGSSGARGQPEPPRTSSPPAVEQVITVRTIGRVRFARAAGRQRSGATWPTGWRWGEEGEVSHLGSLGEPHA